MSLEVGSEVRDAFMAVQVEAKQAFTKKDNGKWLADIYLLAKQRLNRIGVTQIYGGGEWTYTIELSGRTEKLDSFIEVLECQTILEVVRSGVMGIARGSTSLHL